MLKHLKMTGFLFLIFLCTDTFATSLKAIFFPEGGMTTDQMLIIASYIGALIFFIIAIYLFCAYMRLRQKKSIITAIVLFVLSIVLLLVPTLFANTLNPTIFAKPVIYLYPKTNTHIQVQLHFPGKLNVTYPSYKNAWDIIASPNGEIINVSDHKKYSYLFWDGKFDGINEYNMSLGYIIKRENTAAFLQSTLKKMGLTPKEYNEFIVYWLPRMMENEYNLIHFATKEEYDDKVILNISPEPDTVLRVFMVFKRIDPGVAITQQTIKPFVRRGFTAIEWGGMELKHS